jgi:hypothetical protein
MPSRSTKQYASQPDARSSPRAAKLLVDVQEIHKVMMPNSGAGLERLTCACCGHPTGSGC